MNENFAVVEFFDLIDSQWRIVSGMNTSVLGLDYVAVKITADIFGFELDRENMRKLMAIEKFMIANMNKGESNAS